MKTQTQNQTLKAQRLLQKNINPILSIFTITQLREAREAIEESYKDSMSYHQENIARTQSNILQARIILDSWISPDPERGGTTTYTWNDVDLFLKFGPSDKLSEIPLFLETHFPDYTIPKDWSPGSYNYVHSGLCILFNIDSSAHCEQVLDKYIATRSKWICI